MKGAYWSASKGAWVPIDTMPLFHMWAAARKLRALVTEASEDEVRQLAELRDELWRRGIDPDVALKDQVAREPRAPETEVDL